MITDRKSRRNLFSGFAFSSNLISLKLHLPARKTPKPFSFSSFLDPTIQTMNYRPILPSLTHLLSIHNTENLFIYHRVLNHKYSQQRSIVWILMFQGFAEWRHNMRASIRSTSHNNEASLLCPQPITHKWASKKSV